MKTLTASFLMVFLAGISGCQTANTGPTLYEELGGMPAIETVTGNFIREIGYNEQIARHFAESDLDRFYEKMVEHLCDISGGPCEYSGESMLVVHEGMDITEAEFNATVDLLINAMNRSGVPHRLQNRLLARLAPMREEIIYR